ncbi:LysR family transcriptional regulator [Devosia sp. RR2S18]|uniref:LysR family transcriptional regulator n=1 Tax=Devosia rhizosphaerae TaxID=3049774 RepID=UPI0025413739|nr:LysR family transcriptional regulator [Devosia sp. RR2S18]WIJ25090.1 LysR family transcriptional regulator [Devosia sp. RR2S18]
MHKNPLRHDLSLLAEFRTASTFSQVGQNLGIAHTTVSRKVRDMEEHFGSSLLERVGDKLRLSDAGERAADAAERIEQELTALERGISGHDDTLAGRIELTTVDLLAVRYMPQLAVFKERYPGVELLISTDVDVKSLSRREAQVALRLTNAPEDYLYGRVLERLDFYAYAAGTLAVDTPLTRMPWLDYSSHPCASRAEDWMRRHVAGARASSFFTTPLMMLNAVQQRIGAGMLPSVVAEQDSGLQRLSDEPAFSLDVWLLAPKELRRTARVKALFECLART